MSWFKVDDKLHGHRKARALRRSHPEKMRDSAPFGLWVSAGSWASDNRTDGFIPAEILAEWDDQSEEYAARLVAAGLWWETEQAGERGFGFHDWHDYLPRVDGIEDASESGARGNHVRWHVNREQVSESCEYCSESGRDRPDLSPRSSGAVGANREPVPDPTRPDPIPLPAIALREDVERICDHLAARISEDGSKRPTITKTWRDAARLMIDRDDRTEADVHAAIDWCQNDSFWRTNILSVPKLREQYDQLRKRAMADRSRPGSQDETDGIFERAAHRMGVGQ